jgi:nicotinamide mononucleotide transporter
LGVFEITANAIMTLSIWLAARNSAYTWPTGVAGCAFFSLVFLRNQLYADATLQIFVIATSFIGWWQWLHPASPTITRERPVTAAKPQTIAWMVLAAVGVTASYGWLLHRFTDAYLPYTDSAVLALSIMAQCLLMQRKIETWPVWLAVNSLSVALFASRGLLLTAALYGAYWINAWYGWWRWRQERSRPSAILALSP